MNVTQNTTQTIPYKNCFLCRSFAFHEKRILKCRTRGITVCETKTTDRFLHKNINKLKIITFVLVHSVRNSSLMSVMWLNSKVNKVGLQYSTFSVHRCWTNRTVEQTDSWNSRQFYHKIVQNYMSLILLQITLQLLCILFQITDLTSKRVVKCSWWIVHWLPK